MASRRDQIKMSDAELAAFLDEQKVMQCATVGPSGRPHLVPLWFVADTPPGTPSRAQAGGRSAIDYLRSLQQSNGAIRYSRFSSQTPVWVTAQALTALRRKPFPLATVPRRRRAGSSAEVDAGSATAARKRAPRRR
ncbi:MAG: pyridoxamine 5'-phosphate oxidase family protein, partial [Thermoleophilaceae bacterium]|nr:pyridoxamine 5'-phosphate oxidase family protein [Thermoleophilaceae bacterium]